MRAGLLFVILSLLVGQGFREWRRGHEERFQDLVRDLTSRDAGSGKPDTAAFEPRPKATPRHAPVGRIDPSRASAAELERLPGIGPALARRIVSDRDQRGPYRSPDALLRVPGIGPKTLVRIRPFLTFPLPPRGDSLTDF
jgi:competence ComEA-like helix-hairpin-helix protein